MELKLIDELYLELSRVVTRPETAREIELLAALKGANEICRSAFQIAERQGRDTNWATFCEQLVQQLKIQQRLVS